MQRVLPTVFSIAVQSCVYWTSWCLTLFSACFCLHGSIVAQVSVCLCISSYWSVCFHLFIGLDHNHLSSVHTALRNTTLITWPERAQRVTPVALALSLPPCSSSLAALSFRIYLLLLVSHSLPIVTFTSQTASSLGNSLTLHLHSN